MTMPDQTTPQAADEPILFERIDRHIARVTLNRPQARNAINVAMTLRLEAIVRSIDADPEPRAAILAAAPRPAGGACRLPRAIPRAIALEMLTTGASIAAQRAHELGLVNRVVELAALPEAALALAAQVAANAPLSVRESLAIGRAAAELDEAAL